ncbi:MAG TPA: radical SAM family heme chaperone HemW [Gammaproteobacteria bacterium]|nr:radical SAM family heme chaperone HemW [Gammaproteobacteria bacterium]
MPQLIPPTLSLYIHFPWCVKKCPYCDFNSHTLKKELEEDKYIDALIEDLQHDVPLVWGRPVHSVFMGGGTPSLFSAKSIERLLNAVRALLQCKPDMEVTMEVNPGTGEYDNFVGYKQAGVNRLSMGVQSLEDTYLKSLGRIHSSEQAIEVYQKARDAGFDNINLDMMFALPGQNLKEAKEDLQKLIDLQPNHISYYQLTIEANTLFAVHTPKNLPKDSELEAMYLQGRELLHESGYTQYEVSAYSKDNQQCQHNLNYWKFGDYLGIGAGAHAKISFGSSGEVKRYIKHKHPQKYLQQNSGFIQEEKLLNKNDLLFEFMLNEVRLRQLIRFCDFENRTGLGRDILMSTLQPALKQGWIGVLPDGLMLSEESYLLSDEILKLLL